MSSGNNKVISYLCGNVQLKTEGPLQHVSNCHCSKCMITHGNYAAYTTALEKDIKFIKKRTLKWFKSSKKAKRGFYIFSSYIIRFKKFSYIPRFIVF